MWSTGRADILVKGDGLHRMHRLPTALPGERLFLVALACGGGRWKTTPNREWKADAVSVPTLQNDRLINVANQKHPTSASTLVPPLPKKGMAGVVGHSSHSPPAALQQRTARCAASPPATPLNDECSVALTAPSQGTTATGLNRDVASRCQTDDCTESTHHGYPRRECGYRTCFPHVRAARWLEWGRALPS